MTAVKFAKALGSVLLLFVATYFPAFLTVALLKPPLVEAIPVIIVTSVAMAIFLTYVVSARRGSFGEFGFRPCAPRYMAAAFVFGAPVGWALAMLVRRFSSGHLPEMSLPPWMMTVYFVIGASVQEEIIFRGLLQTTLARKVPEMLSLFRTSFSLAAVIIAVLFGLIHLKVNPITAAAAFVLGLLSGEFRYRSGSLLPSILVHALFNAFSAIS